MKPNLVDVKFYGILGGQLKRNVWKLAVKSVSEAIHSINTQLQNQLYAQLLNNDKKGICYRVLINGRDFISEEPLNDPTKPERVLNSELVMNIKDLKTIDVIPVLEGADSDIFAIVLGALMIAGGIIIGVTLGWTGGFGVLAAALIIGGLGLIAAGVINLLSAPPKFDDFREISGGGRPSYLFSGPTNIVGEGGPMFIGYGHLMVGSQVLGASYEISDKTAKQKLTV